MEHMQICVALFARRGAPSKSQLAQLLLLLPRNLYQLSRFKVCLFNFVYGSNLIFRLAFHLAVVAVVRRPPAPRFCAAHTLHSARVRSGLRLGRLLSNKSAELEVVEEARVHTLFCIRHRPARDRMNGDGLRPGTKKMLNFPAQLSQLEISANSAQIVSEQMGNEASSRAKGNEMKREHFIEIRQIKINEFAESQVEVPVL